MECSKNDTGVCIPVEIRRGDNTVESLLGSATALKMYFRKPSGESIQRTAVLVNDGSDGLMKYTTVAGDLDEVGSWLVQAGFTLGGFVGRTSHATFYVRDNLYE